MSDSRLILRHYASADLEQIKLLHSKQAFDYELPGLDSPIVSTVVLERDGKIEQAILTRRTAELYWLLNRENETRREALGKLLIFNKELPALWKKLGYEDVHAWIPPQLMQDQRFTKLLFKLGWVKPDWTCFMREVK